MYSVNDLMIMLIDDSWTKLVGNRLFMGKKFLTIRNQFEFNAFIAMHYDLQVRKDQTFIKFFLPVGEENVVYVLVNNQIGKRFMNYRLCKAVQNLCVELEGNHYGNYES
jgi:hypothetical protein